MHVMQTFGEPRETTNPYLVMLRAALIAEPMVEHLPFSWRAALTKRYDVLHVHWPDAVLAARHWWTRAGKRAALACLIVRLRVGRIAVVRTVHNVTPPAGPFVDRALIRALERRADVQIRLSELTSETPGALSVLIPHGHYRTWYERMPRAAPIPGRLGYVGLIKPYKGVEQLVDAFAAASVIDPSLTLRIAGNPADVEVERELRAAAERLGGVDATLRYVSEDEFVEAITSSELVVLPYRGMHNSGTALAALSLERPILAPDNDVTRALATEVGPGWVHRFSGDLTANALLHALEALWAEPPADVPDLGARAWDEVGARHAQAYRLAVRRRRAGTAMPPTPLTPLPRRGEVSELVVAIPTFQRPEALASALAAVRVQVDTENGRPRAPMHCSILVIDNDPTGSGERIALEHGASYVREPRAGIAAVRNRALMECERADALLFIDDDETPEPGWLRAMIEMYTRTRPTAVAGRVVTRLPDGVEPWISEGDAFARPTRTHGQLMDEAATNNLLLDVDGVRRLGVRFDERFGLTGGSDSMFTRQLTRRGGTIRWAEDAVVAEQEDPQRFTRAWMLRRIFRFGNTSARVRIALARSPGRRAIERLLALARGATRVAGGGIRWLLGVISGSLRRRSHGQRTVSRGLGMMAGAVGYHHDEYSRRRRPTLPAPPTPVPVTPRASQPGARASFADRIDLNRWSFTAKIRTVRRSSHRYLAELERNQYLDPAELARLQARQAAGIARFATRSTPYYGRLFVDHGINLARLEDPDQWESIPITDRTRIKESEADLRVAASARYAREALTGGSTGEPLRTAHDSRVPNLALAWRMYRWWGVEPWDDLARLGRWGFGRLESVRNRLEWWPTRQLYLDAALIDADSMRRFYRDIVRTRPALIEGYVGAVLEFANYLDAEGATIPAPLAVATSAAPLPLSTRRRLEAVYGAPAYDEYRGSETLWMAGECRRQDGLHVFTDARRIEVVGSDGRSLPAGEVGDIVVTDLTNRVFPIVRYRMGDRGSLIEGTCDCGVTLPRMAQPEGRTTDMVRLPSGKALNHRMMAMFAKHPEAVRLFQVHQRADYSIAVRVVLGDGADAARHVEDAVAILRRRVDGEVPVTIEYVASLPYTGAKTKYVVSDVPTPVVE